VKWKGLGKAVEMECNWNGKTLPPVKMEFVTGIALLWQIVYNAAA